MAEDEREIKKYTVYITTIFLVLFIIYDIIASIVDYTLSQDLLYFLILITAIPFVLSLVNYFRK